MAGSVGWRSISNCKCVWQTRGQRPGAFRIFNYGISRVLLRHPHHVQCRYDNPVREKPAASALIARNCAQRFHQYLLNGSSWPHHFWRISDAAVAHWHGIHLGRPLSYYTSMLCQQASNSEARLSFRQTTALSVATRQIMTRTSGASLPENNTPASDDCTRQQRTTEGPDNPAKWADWGVYNYKAVVAYDGTNYKGFQLQKGTKKAVPTVQGVLEKVLCQIRQESRETLRMQCSGRTDAGVHAKGQVINFYSNKLVPDCATMMHSLARMLPDSISVLSIQRVPPDFHARYTAHRKVYHYYVHIGNKVDPFTRWHSGTVLGPIDLTAMRQAAQTLVGQHDFTHFASQGNPDPNPVKTIHRFDVLQDANGYVFQVEGSGFLYKMVRHMVGALLNVGAGNLDSHAIAQKLAMGSKEGPGEKYRGWILAEPQGLFLMSVAYPPHDNLALLCHPDIQHDSAGRPLLGREAGCD